MLPFTWQITCLNNNLVTTNCDSIFAGLFDGCEVNNYFKYLKIILNSFYFHYIDTFKTRTVQLASNGQTVTTRSCIQMSQCTPYYKSYEGVNTTTVNCCSTNDCNNQTAATFTGLICYQGGGFTNMNIFKFGCLSPHDTCKVNFLKLNWLSKSFRFSTFSVFIP